MKIYLLFISLKEIPISIYEVKATGAHLYPLLSVDLHTIGTQRSDGSVNDFVHHLGVAIGLL